MPLQRATRADRRRGRTVVSRRRALAPARPATAAPGSTVTVPVPARTCPFASRAVKLTPYLPGRAPAGIPTATWATLVLLVSGTSVTGVTATVAPGRVVVAVRRKSAAGVAVPHVAHGEGHHLDAARRPAAGRAVEHAEVAQAGAPRDDHVGADDVDVDCGGRSSS